MKIYIDIETIAGTDVPDDFRKFDGRLKDPEKIAADRKKVIDKTVFDGAFGEIVSIAWAVEESTVRTTFRTDQRSETTMLHDFFISLKKDVTDARSSVTNENYESTWVGHHIQFDLGFLFKRSIILQVAQTLRLPWPCNAWDRRVYDTMYEWAGRDTVSLDKLAYVILGERKTDKGSDVAGMWERGEYDKIAAYNASDVDLTRKIHHRMVG